MTASSARAPRGLAFDVVDASPAVAQATRSLRCRCTTSRAHRLLHDGLADGGSSSAIVGFSRER